MASAETVQPTYLAARVEFLHVMLVALSMFRNTHSAYMFLAESYRHAKVQFNEDRWGAAQNESLVNLAYV